MTDRAAELVSLLRALVRDLVREEVERAMLGLRGPDPAIATYTSLRLPPDASRRLFREECVRIPEAVRKGRLWTVPRVAWEAHRERRRGEGRANIRAGRPATGMVVWDDPEAKTIPKAIRVTRADGTRETTRVPEGTTAAQAREMAAERARIIRDFPALVGATPAAVVAPKASSMRVPPAPSAAWLPPPVAAPVEAPAAAPPPRASPRTTAKKAKVAEGRQRMTDASAKRLDAAKRNAQGLGQGAQRLRVCLGEACQRPDDQVLGRLPLAFACARCGRDVAAGIMVQIGRSAVPRKTASG